MTGIARMTQTTPLWRSFIALVAMSVAVSGFLVTFAAPARAATNTIVSLTFDDGRKGQVAAADYLASKGMAGTYYINSGTLGKNNTNPATPGAAFMTAQDVRSLSAAGHEIGGHTTDHADLAFREPVAGAETGVPYALTDTVLEQYTIDQICKDKTALETIVGGPIKSFAWPFASAGHDLNVPPDQGDKTPLSTALTAQVKNCGYTSARGLGDVYTPGCPTTGWCPDRTYFGESVPSTTPYFLKVPGQVLREGSGATEWDSQEMLTYLKEAVTNAESSDAGKGKWLQLTFHNICTTMSACPVTPDGDYDPAMSLATFKSFIDWLATRSVEGTVVRTVGSVVGAGSSVRVPDAPGNVVATAEDGSAQVKWGAPASDGGSTLIGYTVTSSPGGQGCEISDALSCTVRGLSNGTGYTFTVRARNAKGLGATSDASKSVIPFGLPGAPSGVKAKAADTSATVTWTAATDNGAAIDKYTVTSSPDGKTCTTAGTACKISGLTNGTAYSFTVSAHNAAGPGRDSDPSQMVTPLGVPGAPTSVVAVSGNGSAKVSWKAPAANGGTSITGYTVTSSPGGKTCRTTGALSCTVTGLTNGTKYVFWVVASNAQGQGALSQPSGPVSHPISVRVSATKAGYGDTLVVNVDPDRSNGAYAFHVERRTASGRWARVASYQTVGRSQTKSITLGAGVYRVVVPAAGPYGAATSAAVRLTPTVKVRLAANAAKSKLVVDVDPNKGAGYWSFKVQKRRANGSWSTLSTTYKTSGSAETRIVDKGKGTYRVVVAGKYGYVGAASKAVALRK